MSPDLSWLMTPRASEGGGLQAAPGKGGGRTAFPFGRRVVITEDNWLIASDLEAGLQEAGYEVAGIAVSAEEAVAMCADEAPDFVLMDIRLMGERDGVDAAIELRKSLDIPCVFVSAHEDEGTRKRAAPAKPIGWISKPVVGARLPELLEALAQRR